MSKEIGVRSQLYDTATGKYIKAISEHTLSDYLALISKNNGAQVIIIPNMTPVIEQVYQRVTELYKENEKKELCIAHSTIYNLWNKAKFTNVDSLKNALNIEVIRESEKAINLIHTRIPQLVNEYKYPKTEQNPYHGNNNYHHHNILIDRGLDVLLSEIQVFIEISLCHIHSTAMSDPNLLREPSILNHCNSFYTTLQDCLRNEALCKATRKDNNVDFDDHSFIWECCIEDNHGFDPQALLILLGTNLTPTKIMTCMISNARAETRYDAQLGQYSTKVMEWVKADGYRLKRARKIIEVMQQLSAMINLFDVLDKHDVEYNDGNDIYQDVKNLIENK